MSSKQISATRDYEKTPFILTDRKISRVVEVARERLDRVKGEYFIQELFVVNFKNDKELKVDSLERVLSLDNSAKNSIQKISIHFTIDRESEHGNAIRVVFDGTNNERSLIRLAANSPDLGWLQETMGALEEQLERAIPTDFIYSLKRRSPVTLVMVLYMIGMVVVLLAGLTDSRVGPMKLPQDRVAELSAIQMAAKSDQDKIDFVFRYLSSTLPEADTKSTAVKLFFSDYRTYLVAVPLLIGLLSAAAAIVFFYPKSVFAWGDCGEAYERTVERRKFIWYGVVASLAIGVLGNLFVLGVTSWHPG